MPLIITTGAESTQVVDVENGSIVLYGSATGAVVTSGVGVAGPPGERGPVGPVGPIGPRGKDGQPRFSGVGPPVGVIAGADAGDVYLDLSSGDLYHL